MIVPSLFNYRGALTRRHRRNDQAVHLAAQHSSVAGQAVCEAVAQQCVRAFERMLSVAPAMPRHLREEAYQWLAMCAGLRGKQKALRKEFEQHLQQKVEKDLL